MDFGHLTQPLGAPLPLISAPAPQTPNAQQQVPEQIERVAREFESMFLAEMLAPMFEGLDTDGLGGGGAGERMFRPMLVQEYSKAISQAGGIGLSDVIAREMIRMQSAGEAVAGETAPGDASSDRGESHGSAG